ncbi:glycosyl hydrolase family 47-domain-containing protein [Echria macrotheca]|uniref:alpha-1,2-Mannosidase n=1 Tax=Echria macrotheca TaxID=438768 RepID=A0AAJ0B7D4_9PEZI|nr:glycosyl hydrolase family 47-domain-containing protein [Echria macrotheca]
MPRFRKYRVFFIFALIVLALLYHVSRNSAWEPSQTVKYPKPAKPESEPGRHAHEAPKQQPPPPPPPKHTPKPTTQAYEPPPPPPVIDSNDGPTIKIPTLKSTNEVKGAYGLPTKAPTRTKGFDAARPTEKETEAKITKPASIPGVQPGTGHHEDAVKIGDGDGELRYADMHPPKTGDESETSTIIHWTKPYEYYPVPEESLIMLPTGKPKPVPRVQYNFKEESETAKQRREHRLSKIKAEAKRAWMGYKQYAWGHDEVKPLSKGPNDPFCGWAATLVDALDTLWIMGMKDEFDEAVKAVKDIDFTTTPYRSDIPVFETIIRYLGGLVGAYDVTGGHDGNYRILLDKAVELAEILMSVFDTPNRMPILYYHWRPAYNQNPKRASSNSGVAELGSMSMEFTRLAQLTGKNKYYDAIARITDALEDLQNRADGSAIPGIFPQNLDASGCNRTAAAERKKLAESEAARKQAEAEAAKDLDDNEPAGYSPPSAHHDHGSHKIDTDSDGDGKTDLAFEVQSGSDPSASRGLKKRDLVYFTLQGQDEDPDCVPQGLTRPGYGLDSYSMGGSQDSAYEYFPKQYLLLGGLVDKYRAMHEKTVDAVKKYLLFRPQAEGDPDVLFSAKAFSSDNERLTYEYEVTHLTCFLGGMFGLGGKIFGSVEDVEIGKRLAAGCAWAYEVMPRGIMPEYAQILPCANASDCHFDRELWEEKVDPYMADREKQMEEYYEQMDKWKVEVEEAKRAQAQQEAEQKRMTEERKTAQEESERRKTVEDARRKAEAEEEKRLRPVNDTLPGEDRPRLKQQVEDYPAFDPKEKDSSSSQGLRKRNFDTGELPPPEPVTRKVVEEKVAEKVQEVESKVENKVELNGGYDVPPNLKDTSSSSGANRYQDADNAQKPMVEIHIPMEPVKPSTHKEYMEQQHLVPGFTAITDRRYILRPEAIESVWYMYRITGDPTWQDKGWRMFEAVIRSTRTEIGHSAIHDVTSTAPGKPDMADSMESFWLAETLKYFYLLFAEPDVISLDEWVLNTEAHPFRRPLA